MSTSSGSSDSSPDIIFAPKDVSQTELDSTNSQDCSSENNFAGASPSQVAICGFGLRLPGGIRNGDDFWDLLINGKDARGPIPASRYNMEGFDNSLGARDAIKVKHGYFLDEDLSALDTSFFTLTKNELENCDPQQRMLLEVTRECLEDAGEVNYRGQLIGCYVGTFGDDWLLMSAKDSNQGDGYSMTGHLDLMMANRVSYEYDLRGPR
jgi:acyl transferase domain-containing protein